MKKENEWKKKEMLSNMTFKVGAIYMNKDGFTLKITKKDEKGFYFIEMGMKGYATQEELECIFEDMGYKEVK